MDTRIPYSPGPNMDDPDDEGSAFPDLPFDKELNFDEYMEGGLDVPPWEEMEGDGDDDLEFGGEY